MDTVARPFAGFGAGLPPRPPLRRAITAERRRPEPQCVPPLVQAAALAPDQDARADALARRLAGSLRERPAALGLDNLVQSLLQEFSLSSDEGVALMCLAEALLRIPDARTRDALIRDKIGRGDWRAHVGQSNSPFVNAAAWGLLVGGRLVSTHDEAGLAAALTRICAKFGEPMVRQGVDLGMRLMGRQFVSGETVAEALANGRKYEAQGFTYSYDMLGEAAMTARDAQRYLEAYEHAIASIGAASAGRGVYDGPGISIKLSALHPRYSLAQRDRAMAELLPRVSHLAAAARRHDVSFNIDAEEADRLEISLDLLEALCADRSLEGWNGLGFVVQAYQKRCPFVVDHLVDLARRTGRRLMVRLVKGAYWDAEIKRAQVEGLDGYPVFTRKAYTDACYLACARKLLAAPDAIYPQFATHNAHTLAAVYEMAGAWAPGQYEFQCLHGMGEPLYLDVVKPAAQGGLARPCRIYAPVGTHETLLAYLVRRLLENGSNSSFIHRIADASVSLDELVKSPVAAVREMAAAEGTMGLPHPRIPLPRDLFAGVRPNSAGLDLTDEAVLEAITPALATEKRWTAQPPGGGASAPAAVVNPALPSDTVGQCVEATAGQVAAACAAARSAAPAWAAVEPARRAAMLEAAADRMEAEMPELLGLIVREAGKTLPNAVAEVREAVDFLRYYAHQARATLDNDRHHPLGPVACISPWNFPLAIFTGQVAAALAAGNPVLAKPAEQTPLVAAEAVRFLHEAGVPREVVQLLPGRGEVVGAALVDDARVKGVVFTGSTEVARVIQRSLAARCEDRLVPLIAETGGQNAMIVDSSALPEQVVADALVSAFDSAGQRCSALRVLCVQEEIAPRVLEMLQGAMAELVVGDPQRLATDVGPVIDAPAREALRAHVDRMRRDGLHVHEVESHRRAAEASPGTFMAPALVEIDALSRLQREVFGPVLHVLSFRRRELDELVEGINALGYGLTLGIHSRVDQTIARIVGRARVGNIYVNRNIVGAVVGVQPFGGEGLSGTGPKAGGPLYLFRFLATCPPESAIESLRAPDGRVPVPRPPSRAFEALRGFGASPGDGLAFLCDRLAALSPAGLDLALPGPTGERNTYGVFGRESVLCLASAERDLLSEIAVAFAIGARAVVPRDPGAALCDRLPAAAREAVDLVDDWRAGTVRIDAVLCHGSAEAQRRAAQAVAARDGPIVGFHGFPPGEDAMPFERLLVERVVSVNTTAAGGNATLMTVG